MARHASAAGSSKAMRPNNPLSPFSQDEGEQDLFAGPFHFGRGTPSVGAIPPWLPQSLATKRRATGARSLPDVEGFQHNLRCEIGEAIDHPIGPRLLQTLAIGGTTIGRFPNMGRQNPNRYPGAIGPP